MRLAFGAQDLRGPPAYDPAPVMRATWTRRRFSDLVDDKTRRLLYREVDQWT